MAGPANQLNDPNGIEPTQPDPARIGPADREPGRVGPTLRRRVRNPAALVGAAFLFITVGASLLTLPWSLPRYARTELTMARRPPGPGGGMGTDLLGRSLAARTLLGGAISLGLGAAAATISVLLGVAWGLAAGWAGGRTDQIMMRIVDVLYGLPYLLLVILIRVGLEELLVRRSGLASGTADAIVLLVAISAVSWLTMARVIRGQVL